MIVLFMVVSFVIGCIDRMCQLFLSECVPFFSLLVGDSFSSQMINGTVIWLLGLYRIFK